jgi:hypothetical protein
MDKKEFHRDLESCKIRLSSKTIFPSMKEVIDVNYDGADNGTYTFKIREFDGASAIKKEILIFDVERKMIEIFIKNLQTILKYTPND